MTAAVSVAIATYNYGAYLPETLASALGQTFRDIEVIVVDDGSVDQTAEAVRPFLHDRRVRYERLDHQGVGAAKNAAVRRTSAPLIALLDADDVWLPTKLERQLAVMDGRPELGVVYCRRVEMDPRGVDLPYQQPALYRGDVLGQVFRENFICYSSALIRRSAFDHAGGFDESLPMAVDYDLWLRIALDYWFDYVDEPLVKYRRGHANLSSRGAERMQLALQIMERFARRPEARHRLSARDLRQAFAETYFHLALAWRQQSRMEALRWNVAALQRAPGYLAAWKALASLPLPEASRRFLRRVLGRPPVWDRAQAAPGTGQPASA